MASEDELQSLPDGWSIKTLGELCDAGGGDIQTGPFGSQLHSADYVSAGVPSIMPTNILVEGIQAEGIARISRQDAERLQRYRVRAGDIVYSRRGDVEKCALVTAKEGGWLCGTGCLRVRLGKAPTNPDFVHAYLSSPSVRAWIVRHSIGATMPNLNTGILKSLPVALPPQEEMRSIGTIWTALINKTNQLASMNQKLEAIARAIFNSWFVDFDPVRAKAEGREPEGMDADTAALFPCQFREGDTGLLPAGWHLRRAGDLMKQSRESINPLQHPDRLFAHYSLPAFDESRRPKLEYGREIKSNKTVIREGCILLSKLNPHIPRVWLPNSKLPENAVCSTEFLVFQPASRFSVEYLFCQFIEPGFAQRFGGLTTGTSNSHQRVKPEYLLEEKLIDPDPAVVEAFTSVSGPMFEKINANLEAQQTLVDLRDTLLPRLISGKLRVLEAEKLVEAVL